MLDVAKSAIPFDTKQLDRLMDEAGIDVLVATSKHNVQYLLGGHRSIFFDYMDAMGISRYLPLLVYAKGAPEKAAFFGHRLESHQQRGEAVLDARGQTNSAGSVDAMQKATELRAQVRRQGEADRRRDWRSCRPMPAAALRSALPDSEVKDALFVLERLRASKRPTSSPCCASASELVVDSMKAVIAKTGPGMTKQEQFETLRREEVNRGLTFEYLLITAGSSLNRAPSDYKSGQGRYHVAGFGRQLPRLHRRPLPHGHPRRAGCRARGPAGRDRDDPARRHEADQGRRHGRR